MVNTEIILSIFFAVVDGEALYSQQKTRFGADCGSDHELLIAKFRLKLKKVGKTTRPSSYKSNLLRLYSGSDKWIQGIRSDRQSAWRTMDRGSWHFTGGSDQDHSQEKQMQKGKIIVWGGLTNSYEKKRSERQRRKGKIYQFECEVPKNSKEIRNPSSVINAK